MSNPEEEFDRRMRLVERSIDQHGQYLLHYLHSLTKQWQDAENLYNDMWVFVLNRFAEDKIMHVGFLRRKAYQLFVDYWRRCQRNLVTTTDELPETEVLPMSDESYSVEDEANFKSRFFAEYAVNLSTDQQDAVWLYARYGFTYKEIAERLDKPPSTIGDWITHARSLFSDYITTTH